MHHPLAIDACVDLAEQIPCLKEMVCLTSIVGVQTRQADSISAPDNGLPEISRHCDHLVLWLSDK